MSFVLCSNCFSDQGLRLDAEQIGETDDSSCRNCGHASGRKLSKDMASTLAHRFFVWGSLRKLNYGAAPIVQFNKDQKTSISTAAWLEKDIELIGNTLGVGFFYYGPRSWMVGEVEPLKALQEKQFQAEIILRIIQEYPSIKLEESQLFYRIRKAPRGPSDGAQYDSPPAELLGTGRLDSTDFPVMYGSQDLEVCVHECRVTTAALPPDRTGGTLTESCAQLDHS